MADRIDPMPDWTPADEAAMYSERPIFNTAKEQSMNDLDRTAAGQRASPSWLALIRPAIRRVRVHANSRSPARPQERPALAYRRRQTSLLSEKAFRAHAERLVSLRLGVLQDTARAEEPRRSGSTPPEA